MLTVTLDAYADLDLIALGACHSPADWVVRPLGVEAQWSIDGRSWSPWTDLELVNPPTDLQNDSRRLRYTISPRRGAKKIHFVRLRLVCQPTLPVWHPYAGHPSWLMIDEVEVLSR